MQTAQPNHAGAPEEHPRLRVIQVDGTYDVFHCEELQPRLDSALADTQADSIVIDLRFTTSIRSAGLGQLITLKRKASALGKDVTLRGAQGPAAETLRCFKLELLFEMI